MSLSEAAVDVILSEITGLGVADIQALLKRRAARRELAKIINSVVATVANNLPQISDDLCSETGLKAVVVPVMTRIIANPADELNGRCLAEGFIRVFASNGPDPKATLTRIYAVSFENLSSAMDDLLERLRQRLLTSIHWKDFARDRRDENHYARMGRLEALVAKLVDGEARDSEGLTRLAKAFGISSENRKPEVLENLLLIQAATFLEIQERLQKLEAPDARSAELRAQAEDAMRKGDFAGADRALGERVAEIVSREKGFRLSKAQDTALRGKIAALALDMPTALSHFDEAITLFAEIAPAEVRKTQLTAADVALQLAQLIGTRSAFDEAIRRWQQVVDTTDQQTASFEWAEAQIQLGTSHARSGEGQSGVDRFEKAKLAFEAAADVYRQDRYPQSWAATRFNIANVLREAAYRKNSASLALDAIDHYKQALEIRRAGNLTELVAETMCGMGQALHTLAFNTQSPHAARRSVEVLEQALAISPPYLIEAIRTNLANSLRLLAGRVRDERLFDKSIELSNRVLDGINKASNPIKAALITENVGVAYTEWAELTRDRSKSRQALAALDDAERVFRRVGYQINIDNIRHCRERAKRILV